MTIEKSFELQDLVSRLKKEGRYFLDFLKVGKLEAGIIVLHVGEEDTQEPHPVDELYYIIEGAGFIELGMKKRAIRKGSIIFIPAKLHHKFYGNESDLVVLYVFAG